MFKKYKNLMAPGASNNSRQGTAIKRFSDDERGIAAVEFALLAPLLLTLMLGALEITQSIWADSKVEQATSTIGDLVSRTPIMTDTEYLELAGAGPLVLRPNPQNDLKFTVTSVIGCLADAQDPTSDFSYYVLWSKVWQGGALSVSPHSIDDNFTDQLASLEVADGDTLIVTEGTYNYTPTIARKLGQTWEMGGYAFHQPRDKSKKVTYPGVESDEPRSCNDFRAA